MNIVLLGALVKSMKLSHIDWESAIRGHVKQNLADVNVLAFREGLKAIQ